METLASADRAATEAEVSLQRPVGTWAVQAVLVAVGTYVASSSAALGIWTPEGPGPGFFPLVLAVALVVLSIAWFLQTPRREEAPSQQQRRVWRSAGVTMASLVVLGLLLDVIGFQVAMFAFLLFHLRWVGKVRWLTSVLIALAGSVGAFHLFSDLLLVPLPYASVPPLNLWGL
jgi:hypothetical protein